MKTEFEIYKGVLDRKKMDREARIAYESFNGQKAKCNNKNNRWFKHYGGKGLKVEYSAKEFIGWWLHHKKAFKGLTATVGRIDHNKGYNFDNIEMICVKNNSQEAILRNKVHIITGIKTHKKIGVYCKKTGDLIATIPGIRPTAELFGVSQRLVQFLVRGKYKQAKKINFDIKGL